MCRWRSRVGGLRPVGEPAVDGIVPLAGWQYLAGLLERGPGEAAPPHESKRQEVVPGTQPTRSGYPLTVRSETRLLHDMSGIMWPDGLTRPGLLTFAINRP